MSQSSEMAQSQNQENTPPESLGVARILRSSGARLFKSHSKKKQPLQQRHSVDDEGESTGLHKLVRRSSSASQIALRCLKKVRSSRSQQQLSDNPSQHSVRFDLAKNKNHCYEDENYMYNSRQQQAPYGYEPGYKADEKNVGKNDDACGYYYRDDEIDEEGSSSDTETVDYSAKPGTARTNPAQSEGKENTQQDCDVQRKHGDSPSASTTSPESLQSHESPQYAVLVDVSTAQGQRLCSHVEDQDLHNASITTDEYCDYRQGRILAEVHRTQDREPNRNCSPIPEDSRQPIAEIEMDKQLDSKPASASKSTADDLPEVVAVPPTDSTPAKLQSNSPGKRKPSADLTEADGSAAKRVFIKTNAGQRSEVDHRIEHLKAEIQKEEEIERQATQALELSQSRGQRVTDEEIAAEKLLLLSGIKVGKCQSELKQLQQSGEEGGIRRQASDSSIIFSPIQSRPCVATVHLSDICLPLHLGFLSSLGRESVGEFFIAARCGSEVVASTKVKSTRHAASLSSGIVFDDTLTLERVHCDSRIEVEVYYFTTSCKSRDQEPGTPLLSTPTKPRLLPSDGQRTVSSSKRGTRSLWPEFSNSPSRSPAPAPSLPKSSRFQLAASSNLSLPVLQKHTQIKLQEWSGQHVVFGHVFATVTGTAHYDEHQHTGFLTWKEELEGIPNWRRLWCEQAGASIRAWQYPSDKAVKEPVRVIDLHDYSKRQYSLRVDMADHDVSVRKYAIMLTALPPHQIGKRQPEPEVDTYVFSADSKIECSQWIDALTRCVDDLSTWQRLPPRQEDNVEHAL
ncbi:anillin-like [Sycon ciliatum]|uniref:anillin-like n=1 Tax=Sycon ciliatum TaxID=27933 RepID=UPI0031F6D4F2